MSHWMNLMWLYIYYKKVSLGHINVTIGYVRYTEDVRDRADGAVFIAVGVIVAIILLLVIVILIYVVLRRRGGSARFKRRVTALNANVEMYSSQAYSNHHAITESKLNHDKSPPKAEEVMGNKHVYMNRGACDHINPEGNCDHQSDVMANGVHGKDQDTSNGHHKNVLPENSTQSQDNDDDEGEYLKLVKVDDMTTAVKLLYTCSLWWTQWCVFSFCAENHSKQCYYTCRDNACLKFSLIVHILYT